MEGPGQIRNKSMDNLTSLIESLLFVAGKALDVNDLAKILSVDQAAIRERLARLQTEYAQDQRGVRLITTGPKAELVTAPKNFSFVKKLMLHERAKATQAQIETLTILAYRGPLSKIELEDIRGVNCVQILKNLAIENLIDELTLPTGIKYQVSTKFLKFLGLSRVEELLDYNELSKPRDLITDIKPDDKSEPLLE